MDNTKLRYSETHEWVYLEGDVATVGITKYAVDQLTDLVYIELPKVGQKLEIRQPFAEIESVKAVSDIFAPVTGEVIEINESAKADAMSIASDPYGAGWLIKMRVAPGTILNHLMTLEEYEKQIAEQ